MAANSQHIIALLEKYASGQASSGEVDQLFTLLRAGNHDEEVVSYIEHHLKTFEPSTADDIAFWKSRLEGGAQKITGAAGMETGNAVVDLPTGIPVVHRVHFLRRWGWAAASIILLLGAGAYLWIRSAKEETRSSPTLAQNTHIPPGKSGAVLTLADGSQVVLDSLGNGVVADQTGTQVILQDGKLAYKPVQHNDSELTYNTMTTPHGRQFQLTLPDGTGVWLNAGSSIKYPTRFAGNERRVAITGEVYFEVAHNANMPFKVSVNGKAAIEVLGTHFNVNAYDNEEAINTTLLKGSVRVINPDQNMVVLKPGQQAQIPLAPKPVSSKTQAIIKVINNADIDKIMAWKNGLFNFEGASLAEVMRQVERWYNIDITYEKGIPDISFEGKMTKDVPLKDLLVMLERSDIHFRIDNRKLIVLP
ncbi:FecR family protein [Paraflavitalea soli]|uniref:FecR family protein n=1 Tax=Paraflavitalea soli TaxID=2315862 RepID=A0A3B7MNN4_9BACT|nr:FecR family protein [Paraflavitalea soli]AXY74660.1 FecR family protein [Paraflavitalea soli]